MSRRMKLRAAAAAVALLIGAASLPAQVLDFSLDASGRVNADPRIGVNPETGDMLVVWHQNFVNETVVGDYRLFAALCLRNGSGYSVGRIVEPFAGRDVTLFRKPAVAWDPVGRTWLVVVSVIADGASTYDQLLAMRLNPDGTLRGKVSRTTNNGDGNFSPLLISRPTAGGAPAASGRYLLLWHRWGEVYGLRAQVLGTAGKPIGPERALLDYDPQVGGYQTFVPWRMVPAPDGSVLAAVIYTAVPGGSPATNGAVLRLTIDGVLRAKQLLGEENCSTVDVVSLGKRSTYAATGQLLPADPANALNQLLVGPRLKLKGAPLPPIGGGAGNSLLVPLANGACQIASTEGLVHARLISPRGELSHFVWTLFAPEGEFDRFRADAVRVPGTDRIFMVYTLSPGPYRSDLRLRVFDAPPN